MITTRIPRQKAQAFADRIVAAIEADCHQIVIAGSIARMCPDVGDIDLVILPKDPEKIRLRLTAKASSVRANGQFNLLLEYGNKIKVDVFFATPEEKGLFETIPTNFGSLQICRTGSAEFNMALASLAQSKGLHWNPYHGILKLNYATRQNEVIASATEQDIFDALGLPFIAPPDRSPAQLAAILKAQK